ncbi:MAG: hypothetical protein LBH96_04655 [Candidatus Peribacteria bacterium]|jgi:hypothetical protein|nr:hypothetical protein [Candidatus Peribacteria bacterium]
MSDLSFALTIFCEFDDNKAFFTLLWENRKNIVDASSKGEIVFSSDDLLWLRGIFKHISYYNKRYLIPA